MGAQQIKCSCSRIAFYRISLKYKDVSSKNDSSSSPLGVIIDRTQHEDWTPVLIIEKNGILTYMTHTCKKCKQKISKVLIMENFSYRVEYSKNGWWDDR